MQSCKYLYANSSTNTVSWEELVINIVCYFHFAPNTKTNQYSWMLIINTYPKKNVDKMLFLWHNFVSLKIVNKCLTNPSINQWHCFFILQLNIQPSSETQRCATPCNWNSFKSSQSLTQTRPKMPKYAQ